MDRVFFSRPQPSGLVAGSAEWSLVLHCLQELAGAARTVFYAVPAAEAPQPLRLGSIYLHGSVAWQNFLDARRQVDDGELCLLLALRPLAGRERRLVVDWGSSYANAFLLVEPRRPDCDLTLPANPVRRELEAAARALLGKRAPRNGDAVMSTRGTALDLLLREAFGTWTYWTGSRGDWQAHRVVLAPAPPEETLAGIVQRHLPVRFPQAAFDGAVADLYATERELFSGAVARARIPFRTRLGLPILHDPRYVDRALRRLVNAGRALVFGTATSDPVLYGGGQPVPVEMAEEDFERLAL